MDEKCKKYWRPCMPCPTGRAPSSSSDCIAPSTFSDNTNESPGKRGIAFGGAPHASEHSVTSTPVPRLDVPGPLMKTVRDPALSLNALSGIDPSGPLMVEVPVVLNNSTFTSVQALAGWRIGFAHQYLGAGEAEATCHSAAFLQALKTLRSAGALLVPVESHRSDAANQFTLQTRNEIDACVSEHRLDAVVSESSSAAFHSACKSGYPGLCESLVDGTKLWFYGARWAGDRLMALVQVYRQLLQQAVLMPTSERE